LLFFVPQNFKPIIWATLSEVLVKVESIRKCEHDKFIADIHLESGEYYFTTEHFSTFKEVEECVTSWCDWANKVSLGTIDSIYYVIQVPDSWAGPPKNAHPLHGLFIKIGRSKNVLQRLRNLQTGTYGELIITALEPGGSTRESELHKKFSHLRRHGEWFSCNEELFLHVFRTWYRNKMLPPEHQQQMLTLGERINVYRYMREIIGGAPDTVNPSLDDEWHGTTFVDLVYSSLAKSLK
jgi:hypothetical protein